MAISLSCFWVQYALCIVTALTTKNIVLAWDCPLSYNHCGQNPVMTFSNSLSLHPDCCYKECPYVKKSLDRASSNKTWLQKLFWRFCIQAAAQVMIFFFLPPGSVSGTQAVDQASHAHFDCARDCPHCAASNCTQKLWWAIADAHGNGHSGSAVQINHTSHV